RNLQIQPGLWPDIFSNIDFDIAPPSTGNNPPNSPENPSIHPDTPDDLIHVAGSMPDIPRPRVDLSTVFYHGQGWLPKECPPNQIIFEKFDLDFSYGILCQIISDYISPFVLLISGIAIFTIILRGFSNG